MKSTFNKKNSGASVKRASASSAATAAASSSFRLKVVKPSTPSGSSYQFECALDGDFLNNLTMQIGVADGAKVTDITDDLKLESYFLQQALAAAVAGRSRLEACGRTFTRPPTYHAHLLKTVSHLQKIQRVEAEERKGREASMDAKRQRLLKATAKKVQQETLMERQKSRSDDRKKLEEIKKNAKTKNGTKDDGDNGDNVDVEENDDFKVETVLEDIIKSKNTTQNRKPLLSKPKFTSSNPKRQSKDKKFGFGGKDAKMSKRNSKESVNDMSNFSKMNTKSASFGGVGKKVKAGERGKFGGGRGGKGGRGGRR